MTDKEIENVIMELGAIFDKANKASVIEMYNEYVKGIALLRKKIYEVGFEEGIKYQKEVQNSINKN